MPNPFADSPHFSGEIIDNYLVPLQAGTTQGENGLDEMVNITVGQLRQFITQFFGKFFNLRDDCDSATPANPVTNDVFVCSGTFVEEGVTYTEGHVYGYSTEGEWQDITQGVKGPKGDTGDAAGFGTPAATIDANVGTPSVTISATGPDTAKVFTFDFKNLKGANAGFGTPVATIDANVGTPSVTVTATGPDTAKVFTFDFKNIKGERGEGVPAGGSPKQLIQKTSGGTEWVNPDDIFEDFGFSWENDGNGDKVLCMDV